MTRLLPVPLCVLLVALVAAPAASAGVSYEAHDHATPGNSWHVQIDVAAHVARRTSGAAGRSAGRR